MVGFFVPLHRYHTILIVIFALVKAIDFCEILRMTSSCISLDIPIGLLKSKRLGIQNVVMEIDLVYHGINYKMFNARAMCDLLLKRLQWIYVNLSFDSKVFINIRDYSDCMNYYPARVFRLVNFIGNLPKETRPFGILYEELGKYLPEEVAVWTRVS